MIRSLINKTMKGLIAISALSLFAVGCKKDTSLPERIEVTPAALVFHSTSGDVQNFSIKGYSSKKFNRLRISTKRKNGFSTTIKDSSFAGRENFSLLWEYQIENASEDYEVLVYFTLSDESGRDFTTDRLIKVTVTDPALSEYSGIKMYSRWSGQADALYLADLSVRIAALTSIDKLDIHDDSTQIGLDSLLGRTWVSPAGGRMMRFNLFNYAEATVNSLSGAISSGTFTDRIEDIKAGDIILYTRSDDSLKVNAVIRVLGVIDNAGAKNDYYDIAVKKKP